MKSNKMNIPVSINVCCAKHGKSKKELAEFLGIKSQTLSNWLGGRTKPNIFQLEMMAAFFEMTIDEFIKIGA
ncbi:Cro/C1-type helix-turn-helix domain protein [Vibrio phage 137E35-1]|nr:Cro/C1-type helix-turn-helix domain protein [Vibrio phage 137E35-1]CAH9015825.1 Cro/C1-type helix-turn-helix domain protein [Vibrio phage 230E39-1]